jgi:hypothetical protein
MNYEKFIKQLEGCKKDMSDDDIEWFDMGDFQVGMNKGLMDLLFNTDDAKSQDYTQHAYNLKAEDKDVASKFKKYLDDLKAEFEPQDDKKESAWTTEPYSCGAPKNDAVNHPKHYTSGKYEVIDMIAEMVKHYDGEVAYDLGNTVKYIARAGIKNPDTLVEDLRKSAWYLNRAIEKLEKN